MNKRKLFMIIIVSILFMIIGTTFAFLKVVQEGNKRQVITAPDLQVELEEGEELTIQDAMPMYDEVGKIQKAFEFKIVNKSNYRVDYILHLEDITDPSGKKLNYEDVKYYLTKEQEEIKLEKLSERVEDKIDEGTIAKKSEIHYSLRLWIDSEVVENEAIVGKTLSFQIVVEVRKEAKEQYIVHYETGTDLTIEDEIKIEGDDYQITSKVPTKDNYTFLGWAVEENGESVYQSESLYTEDKDLKLYAVWRLTYLYNNGNQYTSDTGGWKYTRTFNTSVSGDGKGTNYAYETTSFTGNYIEWSELGTGGSNYGYYGQGYFQHSTLVNMKNAKTINFQYTVPTVASSSNGVAPYVIFQIFNRNNTQIARKTVNISSANANKSIVSIDTSGLDLNSIRIRITCASIAYGDQRLLFRLYGVFATY